MYYIYSKILIKLKIIYYTLYFAVGLQLIEI